MALENHINQALLEQSPGFFGILSPKSELLTVNQKGLEWIGFRAETFKSGISYENLPCKVADHAEYFRWQDQLVKRRSKPLFFLGYYCYADNTWRMIFGKKYLLKTRNDEELGIVSQFDDVTSFRMIEISRFLVQSSQRYFNKHEKKQFSFVLDDYLQENSLSTRELECLFFLLRGKTAKTIARILSLSPRTVEHYIDQIKSKLGCTSKESVIERTIDMGYLAVLPQSLLKKDILCFRSNFDTSFLLNGAPRG